MEQAIFSIGHSNQPLESFLGLLLNVGNEVLVDVRSQPVSRFSPQFNRKRLEQALEATDVRYIFMGEELGGRPRSPEFYDHEGRVLYGRLAQTPNFQNGVGRLLELLRSGPLAVMCGEEDPAGCHRRLLIGRVLDDSGVRMVHLRRDGSKELEGTFGRSLQRPLSGIEDTAWHSVRPVRGKLGSSSGERDLTQ